MLTFLHAADFHLDSPFAALRADKAAARRRESRDSLLRLADYVNEHHVDLVLLAGDLFDSVSPYRETGELVARALGRMRARVFAAPGNHDWYAPGSPWDTIAKMDNVTVFQENTMTAYPVPGWNLVIHGAAFVGPDQTEGLLTGFQVPADGLRHIGLLHGDPGNRGSRCNPVLKEEIAGSGLDYLALGHIHKREDPRRFGKTLCAWPGCLEGRGFDELGEKGFYQGTLSEDGSIALMFVPFSTRRYEVLSVDITDADPAAAVEAVVPADAGRWLCRILLTGETEEGMVSLDALREKFEDRFYALEFRDGTRLREDIWARSGEDTLRGMFLRQLRSRLAEAQTEEERTRITRAARMGLCALDHRDLG